MMSCVMLMQETGQDTEQSSQATSFGEDAKSFCLNSIVSGCT
jgi:hypothetical protein